METPFGWIGAVFDALLSLIPRIIIVRATHGGVRWRKGRIVKPLAPGLHMYWPVMTDYAIIVTARQTYNLPTQILTTSDNRKVVVGLLVVYRIHDVVQAIGKVNWDVDTTIGDITQAAVVGIIASQPFDKLLGTIATNELNNKFTEATRHELKKYGVSISQCKLTDFAECRVLKLVIDSGQREIGNYVK